tara:strand:- start:5 stop:547 length:543 start_codon:yes stop_codon:yes gene_type:complete
MKLVSRRKALKNTISYFGLGLISPTLVSGVLSGCKIDNSEKWVPKKIDISNLNYIIEWIDIIIPETDTPSASKALVYRFIDEMIEAFLSKSEIHIIDSGIDYLRSKSFLKRNDKEKIEFVSKMARDYQWNPFFSLMKNMTVLGYFNSEVGATMAANYDKTPGKYEGCIPINKYGVKVWAT